MKKIITVVYLCESCNTANDFEHQVSKCRFCGDEVCSTGCGNPAMDNKGKFNFKKLHCEKDSCIQQAIKERI